MRQEAKGNDNEISGICTYFYFADIALPITFTARITVDLTPDVPYPSVKLWPRLANAVGNFVKKAASLGESSLD